MMRGWDWVEIIEVVLVLLLTAALIYLAVTAAGLYPWPGMN
jgi:hypothetical protein